MCDVTHTGDISGRNRRVQRVEGLLQALEDAHVVQLERVSLQQMLTAKMAVSIQVSMCYCSVLRCVVECCDVLLQCVVVCCGVLWCVVACCGVLWCVAVCCSVLQCLAVSCSVLQYVAVCCSVLQCVAVCCSVLQCVAVCCSVLQYSIFVYNDSHVMFIVL